MSESAAVGVVHWGGAADGCAVCCLSCYMCNSVGHGAARLGRPLRHLNNMSFWKGECSFPGVNNKSNASRASSPPDLRPTLGSEPTVSSTPESLLLPPPLGLVLR